MATAEYLDNHFYNKFYLLDEDTIIRLNEIQNQSTLNNVIIGRQPHCYCLELIDDTTSVKYQVYYINGQDKLSGALLQLNIDDRERDNILLIFSMYISDTYKLDALVTFNTFQEQTQSMCEQLGYYTITANQLSVYNNPTLVVKDTKGIIVFPLLFHSDFFRFIFGALPDKPFVEGKSYVYIMFNKVNRYVKIGKSIRPGHRERTLQAEEPKIIMIAYWECVPQVERNLHKLYKDKRVRGEWFDLSYKDLMSIKTFMDNASSN